MPPRRVSSRVTSKRTRSAKAPTTFHSFPLLPPEIRQQIWSYTLFPRIVSISWDPKLRTFTPRNNPPVLLSVDSETRAFALKHYTLSFGSGPEFAHIFFNFERDVLFMDWVSPGAAPGRIGRKLGDELQKVEKLVIHEELLLEHAEEDMRELARFEGLKLLLVLCEEMRRSSGGMFGMEEIEGYWEQIEGGGEERWPMVDCLRGPIRKGERECSRHWWMGAWNVKAEDGGQAISWTEALSETLVMSDVRRCEQCGEYCELLYG